MGLFAFMNQTIYYHLLTGQNEKPVKSDFHYFPSRDTVLMSWFVVPLTSLDGTKFFMLVFSIKDRGTAGNSS
jgi:hypothetical protein